MDIESIHAFLVARARVASTLELLQAISDVCGYYPPQNRTGTTAYATRYVQELPTFTITTRMRVLMININRACAFLHQWLTSHASDFVGKAERRALLVLVDKYLVDTPKGRHLQMMVLHMVHKSSINTRIDWLLLLGFVEGYLRSMIRLVFACVSVISTYHHHTTPTHPEDNFWYCSSIHSLTHESCLCLCWLRVCLAR